MNFDQSSPVQRACEEFMTLPSVRSGRTRLENSNRLYTSLTVSTPEVLQLCKSTSPSPALEVSLTRPFPCVLEHFITDHTLVQIV